MARLRSARLWVAIVLAVLLVLFILQNLGSVEVTVLLWAFETTRAFVILVALVAGVAIGWILKSLQRARKHDAEHRAAAPPS